MTDKKIKRVLLVCCLVFMCCQTFAQRVKSGTLDRKAVVRRHNLKLTDRKEPGPTQVGNGNFSYGFDITGMQTFNDQFTTMSDWGWHSTSPPKGISATEFVKTTIHTHGKSVPYELPNPQQPALSQWLASNPHRFNLGRIGLWIKNEDGSTTTVTEIQHPVQNFDLWSAVAVSCFMVQGKPVRVTTVADPHKDIIAFKIESPLIAMKRLGVFIDFPYANLNVFSNGSDYNKPDLHATVLSNSNNNSVLFKRIMDRTRYDVKVHWSVDNRIEKEKSNRFKLLPATSNCIEYVVWFKPPERRAAMPTFAEVKRGSSAYWPNFWNSGGFIDLSGSRDQRWMELERRVVLSQYIMKINASGNYPPQETGLVNNSWYGRFHYEMILWHSAHYALWDRWPLLNKSIHIYKDQLQNAKIRASSQGYDGARYPKCTGPNGREWPHPIHAFLVWQQPHPIFFADLDYKAHPTQFTLHKWLAITEATADFLASYATFDSVRKQFVLGNPIAFVSENNNFYKDRNPAFELEYWRYALKTAQMFRRKAGLPEKERWNIVYNNLAPIPSESGTYLQWEGIEHMWSKFNFEHPALLGIYGLLPGDGVDTILMKKTFNKVMETWKFDSCWGWDFPLMAMTAARLGLPDKAIDILLHTSPKNGYDRHGLVGGGNPYPYIPANGALLYAIAFMTAGWNSDGLVHEPGFPKNGAWVVRWEDLKKAP